MHDNLYTSRKTLFCRACLAAAARGGKDRFCQSFSAPEDLKIKKSIFKKIWEFIIGEDVENRIVKPYGIFAAKDEKIYITDSGSRRIHIFDLDKKKYSFIDRVRKDEFSPLPLAWQLMIRRMYMSLIL